MSNNKAITLSNSGNGKKSKGKKKQGMNVSVTAVSYNGPSQIPRSLTEKNVSDIRQINNAGQVTSSAAGVINTVFDNYSQASTPADWASLQNLWQEYRILSMEIELIPWNKYNLPTTTAAAPLYTVLDRSNNTPLSSLAGAIDYESCLAHEPSTRAVRAIKMDSVEEAHWIAIGSSPATASRMYVKIFSSGNATSTTYYDFVSRVIVQFRGLQ